MFLFVWVGGTKILEQTDSRVMNPVLWGPLASLEEDFRLLELFLGDPSDILAQPFSFSLLEEGSPNVNRKTARITKNISKKKAEPADSSLKLHNEEDTSSSQTTLRRHTITPNPGEMKNTVNGENKLPAKQMPLLLGFLKDMYNRFKRNIKRSNELETKFKKEYKMNLERKAKWPKSFLDNHAMMNMAKHWDAQRELSHQHYHNMLKLAHVSMAKLKVAIDMVEKAIAGKKLDTSEIRHLEEVIPDGVFMQLESIKEFSHEALKQFRTREK